MKRDMDLCRKILFAIEEQYIDTAIFDMKIENYSIEQIAYHCQILYDAGFISNYKAQYASNKIWSYAVGALTWEGHEFLDKIREDTIWNKTKDIIVKKGLPMALDIIKEIATGIISAAVEGAVKGLKTS